MTTERGEDRAEDTLEATAGAPSRRDFDKPLKFEILTLVCRVVELLMQDSVSTDDAIASCKVAIGPVERVNQGMTALESSWVQ